MHDAWCPDSSPQLRLRARQLAGQITADPQPQVLRQLCGDRLLDHLSLKQLTEQLRLLWRQNGQVAWLEPLQATARNVGAIDAITVRQRRIRLHLTLELEEEGRIADFSGQGESFETDFASVLRSLKGLRGEVGLCCWELNADGPREVLSHQPERAFSVASLYKLYILGALVRAARWEELLRLSEATRSFPTGLLHHWPEGCSLSAHSLATLMISLSDNTAAEVLLQHLGKTAVEEMVGEMGHSNPGLLRPLLSSLDHLRLKSEPSSQRCANYLAQDDQGRRAFLAELAQMPRQNIGIPSAPAELEVGWWAAPADLCRALAWLSGSSQAKEILQVNPGVPVHRGRWNSFAFKGGSEPGVLAAGWLLEHWDGRIYTLAAAWNNDREVVQESRFFALMENLLWLLPEGQVGPGADSLFPISSPSRPWWSRFFPPWQNRQEQANASQKGPA